MKTCLIIFIAALCACNNTSKSNSPATGGDMSGNDTAKTTEVKTDFTRDSVINIKFQRDSSSVKVTGKMNGINKPVTVYIPIKKGRQLSVLLVPSDSIANIRINQIFTPDGKADGPFGRDLKRTLVQEGTYKLIIAEDLMQGDEWKGKFWLTVKVE